MVRRTAAGSLLAVSATNQVFVLSQAATLFTGAMAAGGNLGIAFFPASMTLAPLWLLAQTATSASWRPDLETQSASVRSWVMPSQTDLLLPDVKTQTKIIKRALFACFSWKPIKVPPVAIRCPAHLCAGYSKLPGWQEHAWCHFCPQHKRSASLTTTAHTVLHTHILCGCKSDSDCSGSQETTSLRSTLSCMIPTSAQYCS